MKLPNDRLPDLKVPKRRPEARTLRRTAHHPDLQTLGVGQGGEAQHRVGLSVQRSLNQNRAAEPGAFSGPVLIGFLVAADQLPRALVLLPFQTWGPPWEVAQLRFAALLLAAGAVLLVALSDPASARVRLALRPSR